jgi:hypothetical protein
MADSVLVEVGSRERRPDVVSYRQHMLCWADEIFLRVFTIDFHIKIIRQFVMWKAHKYITSTMDILHVKTEVIYLLPLNSVIKLLWFLCYTVCHTIRPASHSN